MIENSTMKKENLTFRQATVEDIPDLIDCRIRQLIDEGQSPDKDIAASNTEYFREYMEADRWKSGYARMPGGS